MLFKNMWGNYNSALYIQNMDEASSASVTVRFYDTSGNLSCVQTDSLPPLATLS